ncbi:MAG: hypothetical protein ACPHUF_02150 [Gammaproteobacteria bacterium]
MRRNRRRHCFVVVMRAAVLSCLLFAQSAGVAEQLVMLEQNWSARRDSGKDY